MATWSRTRAHGTSALRLAAAASLCLALAACARSAEHVGSSPTATTSSPTFAASDSAPASSAAAPSSATGMPVHIKLLNSDGATYGVGEPIVTYLSARIPNGEAFAKATTVKVNGLAVEGAWHFENSDQDIAASGYPIEGHFRANPASGAITPFWPAHASIEMHLGTKGIATAPGSGQYFDDSLTLRFSTGAAQISYVDCAALTMTATSDGVQTHPTMPISCGRKDTPTYEGTKVVMQKGEDVPGTTTSRPNGTVLMSGTGYTDVPIKWSVRITQSGEYVHDLQSNAAIGSASTSHGCTNLHADDAQWFYGWAQLGDVLIYSNTGGATMPSWDGLGDWNLTQSEFDNETPDS